MKKKIRVSLSHERYLELEREKLWIRSQVIKNGRTYKQCTKEERKRIRILEKQCKKIFDEDMNNLNSRTDGHPEIIYSREFRW